MTIEELKSQLASRGFNFSKAVYDTGVEWYAYRKLETPWNCTCNEKAPALCIYPWDTHGIFSAEFEVVGEVSGENWLKLQCYAVPLDECLDSLARIERILTAAWNAASLAEPELAVRLSDEESNGDNCISGGADLRADGAGLVSMKMRVPRFPSKGVMQQGNYRDYIILILKAYRECYLNERDVEVKVSDNWDFVIVDIYKWCDSGSGCGTSEFRAKTWKRHIQAMGDLFHTKCEPRAIWRWVTDSKYKPDRAYDCGDRGHIPGMSYMILLEEPEETSSPAVRLSDKEMCNLSESILTTKKTGLSYIPCGVIELGRAIEAAVLKKNGLE